MASLDCIWKKAAVALAATMVMCAGSGRSIGADGEQTPSRATAPAAPRPGQLTEESLGAMLQSMKLSPKRVEKQYDFSFGARYQGEEWKLSMSSVLSQDGTSVWVMAWLDEIPSSTSQVPRMALLRLLAANDRLGNGKFFAYIPGNKRFVMQRVIPNEQITTKAFYQVLTDLGVTVVETYPQWSVANWTSSDSASDVAESGNSPARGSVNDGAPVRAAIPQRTSAAESEYKGRTIR